MIIDEERKVQERILTEHLDGLEWSGFCDFEQPNKRACQKGKIEPNEQSKEGGQPKKCLWKKAGCQTESKVLEKLIVERIVREPGLTWLNLFEIG